MDIKAVNNIIDNITARTIPVIDYGIISYNKAFDIQSALAEGLRKRDKKGVIILLEHTPVITVGSNRSNKNLLTSKNRLKNLFLHLIC